MTRTIESICRTARGLADVDEGTSCSQASFKVGRTAFLYVGMQGGRGKLMVKLSDSLEEVRQLADTRSRDVQIGNAWVTVRFCNDHPLPAKLWRKWLKESYRLCVT